MKKLIIVAFIVSLVIPTSFFSQCNASFQAISLGASPTGGEDFYFKATPNMGNSGVIYSWDFGNNLSLSVNSNYANIKYLTNGVYNVRLIRSEFDTLLNLLCSDTVIQSIQVTQIGNPPCLHNPNIGFNINANGLVSFNTNNIAASGLIVAWDFGDGILDTGAILNHTYAVNGTYEVEAHIFVVGTSCTYIRKQTITVQTISPNCNLDIDYIVSYTSIPGLVNFRNETMYTTNTNFTWHFGNGNSSISPSTSNFYTTNGNYNLLVYASQYDSASNSYCIDTATTIIQVTNVNAIPCIPNFHPNVYTNLAAPNGFVQFFAGSSGLTNTAYKVSWDFGDGGTDTGKIVTHKYNINGRYTCKAFFQAIGSPCIDTLIEVFNIMDVNLGICLLNADYIVNDVNAPVIIFYDNSIGLSFNNNYSWDFGDGNFGTGPYTVNNYTNNGTYNVKLIVTTFDHFTSTTCKDSTIKTIVITNANNPCSANANFTIFKDTSANLTWNAVPVYSASTISAKWLWGDGTSTIGFNPSHTYATSGIYNICLIVIDSCGAIDTTCLATNIFKMVDNQNLILTLNVLSNFTALDVNTIENFDDKINIYPNPNNGEFLISSKSNLNFNILNVNGQIVYSSKNNNSFVNINGINAGVYFIVGTNSNGIFRKKLIVAK